MIEAEIRMKLIPPYQVRAWNSRAPVVAFIGGTGSGKTWLAARWLVVRALHNEGEYIACSPTLGMLKRTLWKEIKRVLREYRIPFTKNEQDMVIHLNGSLIYGISADKPERMEGIHARAAVLDEAGQMDLLAWEVVQRRTAMQRGQILISTTPYRWNWLKTDVYDRAISGDANFELIQAVSIDNPEFPRERFERAKRELPEWRFKMFYLAQFTRPLGLIYHDWEPVHPFEIPSGWLKIRGLDFGYNNPTAVIWLAQSPEGTWYAYKEFKRSEVTLDTLEEILKKENIPTYGDPEARQALETLRRRGCDVRPANCEVLSGISYVQGLMKQKRLLIFKDLIHTIDELNTYSWKLDANDEPLDQPEKKNDHLMDALRMALWSTAGRQEGIPQAASRKRRESYDLLKGYW